MVQTLKYSFVNKTLMTSEKSVMTVRILDELWTYLNPIKYGHILMIRKLK